MNYLAKCCFALALSLTWSEFIAKLLFEKGQLSYKFSSLGLGLALAPTAYRMLSQIFATKVVFVSKEVFAAEMEKKMKELKDKVDNDEH